SVVPARRASASPLIALRGTTAAFDLSKRRPTLLAVAPEARRWFALLVCALLGVSAGLAMGASGPSPDPAPVTAKPAATKPPPAPKPTAPKPTATAAGGEPDGARALASGHGPGEFQRLVVPLAGPDPDSAGAGGGALAAQRAPPPRAKRRRTQAAEGAAAPDEKRAAPPHVASVQG